MREYSDIVVVHFHILSLFQFISDEPFNIQIDDFSGNSSLRLNLGILV
jgi:hypothetical protein